MRARPLALERLEDRCTPSTSGITWGDGMHLTLSFVPDGTKAGNYRSDLFAALNAVAPTATWQGEVLRAFQTWAVNANLNVGVVPDGGQPLGTAGAVQGDPRFGDIRIAAAPLPAGTLATNTPFEWSGTTWSGDILINSSYLFSAARGQVPGSYDLFTAMLNESGNVLGVLDSRTDTASGVYYHYLTARTGIDSGDVADIQSLYGTRSADGFDALRPNGVFASASPLPITPGGVSREADIAGGSDVDFYQFTVPATARSAGDLTVNVRTAGLSALAPSLQVYDSSRTPVGSAATTDPLAGDLTVRVSQPKVGATYYIKVAGNNPGSVFNAGSYRLNVALGEAAGFTGAPPAPVDDAHTNDTLTRATPLAPQSGAAPAARAQYTDRAVIGDAADAHCYRVHSPSGPGPWKMNVLVWAADGSPLVPKAEAYNAAGKPVAATLLGNEAGTYSIEVPAAAANATYFVKVSALLPAGSRNTGDYSLRIDFDGQPATADAALAGGTLTASANRQEQALTVPQNRLYEFVLAATNGAADTEVRMDVLDASGRVAFALAAYAGMPAASGHAYLAAGSYTVRYTAAAPAGPLQPVGFTLTGRLVSDPIGPRYTSSTSENTTWGGSTSTTGSSGYCSPYYF